MPAPDYQLLAGTVMGEVRNEVFNRHGISAYETAKYGWHHSFPTESINKTKMYTLVSGSFSVEFLLATITYALKPLYIDTSLYSGSLVISSSASQSFVKDIDVPLEIEFLWYNASMSFLDKNVADAQGVTYTLQ